MACTHNLCRMAGTHWTYRAQCCSSVVVIVVYSSSPSSVEKAPPPVRQIDRQRKATPIDPSGSINTMERLCEHACRAREHEHEQRITSLRETTDNARSDTSCVLFGRQATVTSKARRTGKKHRAPTTESRRHSCPTFHSMH